MLSFDDCIPTNWHYNSVTGWFHWSSNYSCLLERLDGWVEVLLPRHWVHRKSDKMNPLQGAEWLDHYTTNVLLESSVHQTILMAIILGRLDLQCRLCWTSLWHTSCSLLSSRQTSPVCSVHSGQTVRPSDLAHRVDELSHNTFSFAPKPSRKLKNPTIITSLHHRCLQLFCLESGCLFDCKQTRSRWRPMVQHFVKGLYETKTGFQSNGSREIVLQLWRIRNSGVVKLTASKSTHLSCPCIYNMGCWHKGIAI